MSSHPVAPWGAAQGLASPPLGRTRRRAIRRRRRRRSGLLPRTTTTTASSKVKPSSARLVLLLSRIRRDHFPRRQACARLVFRSDRGVLRDAEVVARGCRVDRVADRGEVFGAADGEVFFQSGRQSLLSIHAEWGWGCAYR